MMTRNRTPYWFFLFALLAACLFLSAGPGKDEWLPITPEDLALKSVPESPGAHAIILYRESFSDDVESFETHYFRIKIFDDEGKSRADVEVPFVKGRSSVEDIRARTIRPDGSVVSWDGKAFEKVAVKASGIKLLVKSFTLPEVTAGSIIEYKYREQYDSTQLFATFWSVQDELFTRKARFTIRPYNGGPAMMYRTFLLPDSAKFAKQKDGTFGGEVANIPALQVEDHMPPERELKSRVEFYYTSHEGETHDQYWKRIGKEMYEDIQKFVNKRKAAEQAIAETVSPGDAPEIKLRKLYARAQQIRNLSYDTAKTEKEETREKRKPIENIEDALKQGYAFGNQVNWVFLALARAAGFEADAVYVASRSDVFFHPDIMDIRQLGAEVVWVRAGDKDLYLDPASKFCPFGLLPWQETSARGIRVTKEGSVMIATPPQHFRDARVVRKADLTLSADGALEGKVQLSFFGQHALVRRVDSRNEDDTERRKDLEAEIKNWVPSGATYEVTSSSGWEATDEPLLAEYKISAPNLATSTGRRMLLPLAVTVAGMQNPFPHAQRNNPVYLHYPYEEVDEITIHLPPGYEVENIPAGRKRGQDWSAYELSASQQPGALVVKRRVMMEGLYFQVQYYPQLRAFFNEVTTGDQDRAVLRSTGAATPD